jgi:hypothetical protein
VVVAIALAISLSGFPLAGCGGSDSDSACGAEEPGERIELHNSGIECDEASALVNVLPDITRPQKVGSGKDIWVCTYLPERYQPVKVRCSQGKRFFTLVDTD